MNDYILSFIPVIDFASIAEDNAMFLLIAGIVLAIWLAQYRFIWGIALGAAAIKFLQLAFLCDFPSQILGAIAFMMLGMICGVLAYVQFNWEADDKPLESSYDIKKGDYQ